MANEAYDPIDGNEATSFSWPEVYGRGSTFQHATFSGWGNVQFLLMDEQLDEVEDSHAYVPTGDPASYEGFAQRNFIDPLEAVTGIAIPVIKPELDQLNSFAVDLDLLVLAVGINGNYANVMPGTLLDTGWHVSVRNVLGAATGS